MTDNGITFCDIVGTTVKMQQVFKLISLVARTDTNAVIFGESGTGKELVARAIHSMSRYSDGPFVAVNCGGIPKGLVESEFFGYKKGAFTGAEFEKTGFLGAADRGILFLDEVGEIDLDMQVRLLRVFDGYGYTKLGGTEVEQPDFQIVAATNKNLENLVEQGCMREDFYYRINVMPLTIPPLRERKADIPHLVTYLLDDIKPGMTWEDLTEPVRDQFLDHPWPGNVRELQNALYRYAATGSPGHLSAGPSDKNAFFLPEKIRFHGDFSLRQTLETIEIHIIKKALEQSQGNKSRAAGLLGMDRRSLYRRLELYGLE